MTIQQSIPAPAPPEPTPAGRAFARHADDGTIPRDQGRPSRAAAVLPDGRFLRAVLRGRRDRLKSARHRADQARQASGHGYPDVRRAGGALRGLSAPPDRRGPSRRGVRADGRSGRRARPRQQERGAPRRGAAGDAGHADRRHAARCPHQQLSARDRARPRLVRRRPRRPCLDRHLDLRIHGDGMLDGANSRRRWRGSIRTKSSSPMRSMAMRIWARCCANCRR